MNRAKKQRTVLVAGFSVVSWLGMMVHNAIELPNLPFTSPEVAQPSLAYVVFFAAWRVLPYWRVTGSLLFIWGMLHLVIGGIITVIPFPFLPFTPEQSVHHYLAHVVYSVTQFPLVWMMYQNLRTYRTLPERRLTQQ